MVLHPVVYPNHGPEIELGLAKEAIGLAQSLGWETVTGPTGQVSDEEKESEQESDEDGRGRPRIFSYKENAADFKKEGIREGDYCYSAGGMQGVYTNGGLVLDLTNE